MKPKQIFGHPLIRNFLAIVVVALTAGLRAQPLHALNSSFPWITFLPAVIVSAVFGGLSAGLLATGLACVTIGLLWSLFAAEPVIKTNADWLQMSVFILIAGMISAACEAVRRTHARLEVYHTLVKSLDDGFCVVEMLHDAEGKPVDYRFLQCNPAFEKQTGIRQATGKTMRNLVPSHESHWFEIYERVAGTGEDIRFENVAAGMQRHYDVFAFRVGGSGSHRVGILFKDITERKKNERDLIDASLHDSLTGLSNRVMCLEHLSKALARAKRSKQNLAFLFLDLDGFKAVNDNFGHLAGDNLLRTVAERLLSSVRAGDVVSRFGGDEFTVILESYEQDQLPDIAERITRILELPVVLDEGTVQISVSIGIASYPESALEEESLIQKADAAMYVVKRDRKLAFKA